MVDILDLENKFAVESYTKLKKTEKNMTHKKLKNGETISAKIKKLNISNQTKWTLLTIMETDKMLKKLLISNKSKMIKSIVIKTILFFTLMGILFFIFKTIRALFKF